MSDTATEHSDIQGIVRGFDTSWPWARFVLVTLSEDAQANQAYLQGLDTLWESVYTAGPASIEDLSRDTSIMEVESAFNVAFSYQALTKLDVNLAVLQGFPDDFAQGMRDRCEINGDDLTSHPDWWEDHWRERSADVWIGLYARSEAARERCYDKLLSYSAQEKFKGIAIAGCDEAHRFLSGKEEFWIDDEESQPPKGLVMEHFGFRDGISNPAYKGINDVPKEVNGGGKITKKGNWAPLKAGELLFGHIDEVGEIPIGPMPQTVSYNGTFMVYRKLSQDIDGFRDYLTETAAKYDGMSADYLAAKMVGRKRSGVSLLHNAPTEEDKINDFKYDDDPRGLQCPLGSHARRTNPRDTLEFQSLLVDRHRMLRRAMPYDKPVDRQQKQADVNAKQRVTVDGETREFPGQGLVFICLNIDIVRQFEFTQAQWVNFGNDLNQGSDRDPIIGNHSGKGRMVFPGKDDRLTLCPTLPRFVETRGGDYFFLPGLRAYNSLISGGFS